MLRIVGILTIMLVLLAGCSREPAEQTGSSSEGLSDQSPAQGTDSGSDAAAAHDASADKTKTKQKADKTVGSDDSTGQSESDEPSAAMDPRVRGSVLKLLDQMSSEAAVERIAARKQLDELGEAGIPHIVAGLREGTLPQQRGAATYLVGRVSPRDGAAAAALIAALRSDDATLRQAALQAVEKLSDAQLVTALPALIAFAANPSESEAYRSRAIRAISKLGAQAATVSDEVTRLALEDPAMNVRRACFYALSKIAPREAAETFYQERLANDSAADLRRLAAKWLPGVAKSDQSLRVLIAATNDSDESVRLQAVDSLVELGKPAIPGLIKATESPEVQTRRHAVLALGKMGLLAIDAKSALEARLDDPDQQVRELAQAALEVLK